MPNGNDKPKIEAHPIIGEDGKPVKGAEKWAKTLKNVIAILNLKGDADKNEEGETGDLGKKLKKTAKTIEKLLNSGHIVLVDDIPQESPARTKTNPKNPEEKRIEIRTEMVEKASNICHPLFLYLTDVLFHEGIHVPQKVPQRPKLPDNWDAMNDKQKREWYRNNLLPYKMKVAAHEYEAYSWNLQYISQMPDVIDKIKKNKQQGKEDPLDGLSENERKWGRLWKDCNMKGMNAAEQHVKRTMASKKAALAGLGQIVPDGNIPSEDKYDDVENALGANEGELEKILDTGHHYTWFFIEQDSMDLLWIGFRGNSKYSFDGVDLGMKSPQSVLYSKTIENQPYILLCGTTEIDGTGSPRILLRPASFEAYNAETDSWAVDSLEQFSQSEEIEINIPGKFLNRPTALLKDPSGRVLVWDADLPGLFPLLDENGDGFPDTVSPKSIADINSNAIAGLDHFVSMEWYGEQPACFTRPVTIPRGTAPVIFLRDPDKDGSYEKIDVVEPLAFPWLRPSIVGIVQEGDKIINASGTAGNQFQLTVSGDATFNIKDSFKKGRSRTRIKLPELLKGGETLALKDLANGNAAVTKRVAATKVILPADFDIALRKTKIGDIYSVGQKEDRSLIGLLDAKRNKIFVSENYGEKVKDALQATKKAGKKWLIHHPQWRTEYKVVPIEKLNLERTIQKWHAFVVDGWCCLPLRKGTGIDFLNENGKFLYSWKTRGEIVFSFPAPGFTGVEMYKKKKLKLFDEPRTQGNKFRAAVTWPIGGLQ